MGNDDLAKAKKQRDSIKLRIQLKRDGKMKTQQLSPYNIDTTDMSLKEDEEALAAIERKIARLEGGNA